MCGDAVGVMPETGERPEAVGHIASEVMDKAVLCICNRSAFTGAKYIEFELTIEWTVIDHHQQY